MYIVDLINKKRMNGKFNKNEIKYIVDSYVQGKIEDYQMSALLMAICINGLDSEETIYLTDAMLDSGDKIDLSSIPGIKVDKHSTGGVGDKTTIIVLPIVASLGVPVAKMSGRGLGYTGGTIDKLESIPGFNVNVNISDFINQVKKYNICIGTTTSSITPADKKIYALRDVTGTVSSKSLIAASIMSKKLATGADKILLDVKYGNGALLNDMNDAIDLAKLMVYIGNSHGKETRALITNMNYPLGNMVGNALEVKEAIDVLTGGGNKDLRDLCITLASYMVSMSKNSDFMSAQGEVLSSLRTGKAYQKFLELVKLQGGNINSINISSKIIEIKSTKSGFINNISAISIAEAALKLGSGRMTKNDTIDMSVGIETLKNVGDYVNIGDSLAKIYVGSKEIDYNIVLNAFEISDSKIEKEPIIYGIIK